MNAAARPHDHSSAGALVATVAVGLGAVLLAVVAAVGGWGADQFALVSGDQPARWRWPVAGLAVGIVAGAAAALLALVPRSAAVRAAGRVWLLTAVTGAALTAARAIPAVHHEAYLATVALIAGSLAVILRVRRSAVAPAARFLGAAAGLVVLLPWLYLAALGGVSETLLAGAAAAALGCLAARIVDAAFWLAFARSPARLVLGGGTVAGVGLTLLAAGVGHSGVHLAELLVLPPLGWVAAALWALSVRAGHARPSPHLTAVDGAGRDGGPGKWSAPVGWIVGLAAAGPLAATDPEEVSILLATSRDVPAWTGMAAAVSWALAVLLAAGYALGLARRTSPAPSRCTALVVMLAVLAGAGTAQATGQPGFHGDRLFVVLREQADLSGIATLGTGRSARDARVTETYRRLVATAVRSQTDLRAALDRFGLPYTPYYLVNGVEVAGGPEVRAWLARRPDVARVLVSQRLRPLPGPPGATRGGSQLAPTTPPWGITRIGADRARTELGVTGQGIVVGSSDSGVDGRHPALAGTFRGGDDSWYDPWEGSAAPTDRAGHGTHTLATAVGGQNVGVAPGASWTGCVNLNRNLGNPARYLDCLQFMLAPFPPGADPFTAGRPGRAPHVLTNSWGCPPVEGCDAQVLRPAVGAFAAAGIAFVAAAGNTGPGCGSLDDPPAPYAEALTVGAVGPDGVPTDFSSRGPAPGGAVKPDLDAPGADVMSALPGGTYGALDGTSMAAPHVAGAVALLWSAHPELVGDLPRTRDILTSTAVRHRGDGCGQPATRSGTVDVYAALRSVG